MVKKKLSIILPCHNEEASIAKSIRWAKIGLRKIRTRGYTGEIIVVNNFSTDRSVEIAQKENVRIVHEPILGYGRAYQTGIKSATGNFIILGDSDGTYDFRTIEPFVHALESGADLVLGSRIHGTITRGSMSFSHRYIGNPLLTAILNLSLQSQLSDTQTGMRALTRASFTRMRLMSRGMEFASEMIIKAKYHAMKIVEVPIAYYPRIGRSKLSPISDAWRHIKFIILYAPTYIFVLPGAVLTFWGSIVSLTLLAGGRYIFGWFFDIHTMTLGILAANLGVQLVLLGIFAKVYTEKILKLPSGPLASFLLSRISVEKLLLFGSALFTASMTMISLVTYSWISSGFGSLEAVREVLFAAGVGTIGAQIMFASFLYGLLKES